MPDWAMMDRLIKTRANKVRECLEKEYVFFIDSRVYFALSCFRCNCFTRIVAQLVISPFGKESTFVHHQNLDLRVQM